MTEANTQAEFYHHARLIGLPVELELSTPAGRLDIAVLNPERTAIVAIVECKKDGITPHVGSYQLFRYRKIGVPLYCLTQFSAAESLARDIATNHASSPGIPLKEIRLMPRFKRTRRGPETTLSRSHSGKLHIDF